MKVGLTRALLNYDELPLWQTFLAELGAEVLVSPETNRAMLEAGLARAVDESCLPVKAFVGHALTLGRSVDFLLVPRLVNRGRRGYYCPKLAGLPDIARSLAGDAAPVLEVTFDTYRNPRGLAASLEAVAARLDRPGFGRKAYARGLAALPGDAGSGREGAPAAVTAGPVGGGTELVTIGLLGRSYSLDDPMVGFDVKGKLRRLGVQVITEDRKPATPNLGSCELDISPKLYWEQDRRMLYTARSWLAGKAVDGVAHVISFECGPDALFTETLTRLCRKTGLPSLSLVLDEHVEEAGLMTRLEAFVDLLAARIKRGRRRQ